MAYVNVAEWNPEHVSDWLKGLDDEVQPYTQFFVNNSINGCHLLTLCRDDLANLNIFKVGHQELVLEAVDLLKQLHYNLTSETLQSLALKLGCKSQSLYNQLKHMCNDHDSAGKKERVSTETLSAVSDILNLVKSLISWLDRYPFLGQEKYTNVRKTVLKLSVELASTAQRDQFAEMPHKVIKEICSNLSKQSDKIVQEFNDSLIIQPAILEVAKIKRKADDDVGIHINSSCTGIHVIESIKFQSPAYRCGKIEDGDEIVQVNYQTVVGWQVRNIICAMKEHPSEVHLTLKKRPRHPNVLGQVITLWPYRIPSKKTALRKLYKWNKVKSDINDMGPKSPEQRCDINSVPETSSIPTNDKERQQFFGRSRNRIRRRATITGIEPTALQPLLNLDDFLGNNSKKKQSVGRAVSYDPGKVGNVEDGVFNDGQDAELQPNNPVKKEMKSNKVEKEMSRQKSQFLEPPTEKYLGSCLRRQQQVIEISPQSEVSDIKLLVDFAKADGESKGPAPGIDVSQVPIIKADSPTASGEQLTPNSDWLQQHKAQLDTVVNGHSRQNQPRPGPCQDNVPSNPCLYPQRENRPSLSEIRALKKAADAKLQSERVEPHTRKNVPLPRQNILNKRHTLQNKLGGSSLKHVNAKENELSARFNGVSTLNSRNGPLHLPPNCMNPGLPKYSMIPQYPYEMHESKIVSLKHKKGHQQPLPPRNKVSYVSEQRHAPSYSPSQKQLPPKPSPSKVIINNVRNGNKSAHQNSFNPMFGRSRSYNDIAFSSDTSSCDEDDDDEEDMYGKIRESRTKTNGTSYVQPQQMFQPDMSANFAAKVAEAYYMLNQGHCFPNPQAMPKNGFDPTSSAIIDELAKRMYFALQQDHMKMAAKAHNNKTARSKSLSRETATHNGYNNRNVDDIYDRCPPHVPNHHQQHYQSYDHMNRSQTSPAVREEPINLSPPTHPGNKHSVMGFKSATSQEILSLYTSQMTSKSPNSNNGQFNYEKQNGFPNEHPERPPIYESLSFFREPLPQYPRYASHESSVRVGHGNQSIMFCPAEKESESAQCNDQTISKPSDGWKYFDKGMFQPIKEETSVDDETFDNFMDINTSVSMMNGTCGHQNGSLEHSLNGTAYETKVEAVRDITIPKANYRNDPPSISSLISNMPKPPTDDCSYKPRRCSDAQTETEVLPCSEVSCKEQEDQLVPLSLGNDDSFCTQNSDDSPNFTRSSSLSSSASSSTISSNNSSYYYAAGQTCLHSENGNDLSNEQSPTLPTMGVSMLSKKHPSNSSDSGCQSDLPLLSFDDVNTDSGEEYKSPCIITDNIQFSVWKC